MGGFLRQATASQAVALGPFLDDTDFKTPETGLTIANTDIKLVVNGGASANKNSGGGTHRVNGVYGVTFDATDTATVGEMQVSVVVTGALPVFDKFFVIEEAVYDRDYAASALGYVDGATVNATKINSVATTSVTTINANLGTTQPVNFTGTAGSALVKTDMVDIAGAAVSTSTAQIGVNVVSYASGQAPLQPTVAGRTLDVSTGGEAGLDWNNIGTPSATVNLSNTTVATVTTTTTATNVTTVNGLAAGVITATSIATDAITAAKIAADAIGSSELAASAVTKIWDEQVDGTVTARQSMRLNNSAQGGKLSGAATTTVAIRDLADTKDRVSATVDSSGNRTTVTLDLT